MFTNICWWWARHFQDLCCRVEQSNDRHVSKTTGECPPLAYTALPAPGNQDLGLAAGSGGFDSWDPGEFGVVPDEDEKRFHAKSIASWTFGKSQTDSRHLVLHNANGIRIPGLFFRFLLAPLSQFITR